VNQLRRDDVVEPNEEVDVPPLEERKHSPYWKHPYTRF
jgi:hypothetical protein